MTKNAAYLKIFTIWIGFVLVLCLSGCGALGYYIGGKAKASDFNKICQSVGVFHFKDYPGEYTCFRIDVDE